MKSVLGAILGYISMMLTVFITLTASYFALGSQRAFEPNSYRVTAIWWSIMLVFSFIAAIVGGKVCRWISGQSGSIIPLVALVLVLGAVSAVPAILASSDEVVRAGDVPLMEAMSNAQQPKLITLLLPVVAAAGVVIGGRKKES
jgi:type IV secretory pathway TrbF-like protein